MPVRGKRNAVPKSGGKPTGIFSSRGKQKQDGATGPNMDTFNYAHRNKGKETLPTDAASKRHQQPRASGTASGRNAGKTKSIPL